MPRVGDVCWGAASVCNLEGDCEGSARSIRVRDGRRSRCLSLPITKIPSIRSYASDGWRGSWRIKGYRSFTRGRGKPGRWSLVRGDTRPEKMTVLVRTHIKSNGGSRCQVHKSHDMAWAWPTPVRNTCRFSVWGNREEKRRRNLRWDRVLGDKCMGFGVHLCQHELSAHKLYSI